MRVPLSQRISPQGRSFPPTLGTEGSDGLLPSLSPAEQAIRASISQYEVSNPHEQAPLAARQSQLSATSYFRVCEAACFEACEQATAVAPHQGRKFDLEVLHPIPAKWQPLIPPDACIFF